MASIIYNRIDFNVVGALRGQRHVPGGSGVSNDDTNSLSPTWTLKLTESWGGYKENDSEGEVESEIGVACAAIP